MTKMNVRTYGIVMVALSAVLWSTAGVFVRMANLDTWTILGWRSLFSAVTLGVFIYVRHRSNLSALRPTLQWPGAVSAIISMVSSVAYIVALRLTTVANVMTIYAMLPFIAAGIAYFYLGEKVTRRFIVACTTSLIGVGIMAGAAATRNDILGILAAVVMTAGFGTQLVYSKRHATLNMSLIIVFAALGCVLAALPFMQLSVPSFTQIFACALYGTLTTGFAYVLVLAGGRHISSGEAAFVSMLDVVLGPLWVWLFYDETPSRIMLFGGVIVLVSVTWYLARGLRDTAVAHAATGRQDADQHSVTASPGLEQGSCSSPP